jgi:phage gpG-like protein
LNYGTAIEIVGLDAVKARLAKVESSLKNNEVSFKRSVAVVDGWVQRNFRSEGGNVGGWAKLADSTIESRMRRRNKTGAIRILQDIGTLRMKWKHLFGKDYGALVSAVDYGIFHETGTSKMPQRRILPTMDEIWPKIKELFSDELRRSIHD